MSAPAFRDPWEALIAADGPQTRGVAVTDHRPDARGPIAVAGAVGGTGATTVACALALAAAAAGASALVELDLDRGGLAAAWGVPPERTIGDLVGVVDELRGEHLEVIGLRHASGVTLYLAPGRLGAEEPWRAGGVARLLGQLPAAGGPVIVDCGPLHGAIGDQVVRAVAQLIVVTVPTIAGAARARAAIAGVRAVRPQLDIRLVVNRGCGRSELGQRGLARLLGEPVHAVLPRANADAAGCLAGRWITRRRSPWRDALAALEGA